MRRELGLEALTREMRMAARRGETTDVGNRPDFVRQQQLDELVGGTRGVTDGTEGGARGRQNSRFFISLKK